MRKLVFGINVTIDGCCDHTTGVPNDEVHNYFAALTREAGTLLYGRKTYELMVPFWPDIAKNLTQDTKRLHDFAQAFSSVPEIVVFSKTLAEITDRKTRVIRAEPRAEIQKMKSQPGKSILTGGVGLPSELLELGLIDEVKLVVHPMIAGKGRRLFDQVSLVEQFKFALVDSQVFKSGHVAIHYAKN